MQNLTKIVSEARKKGANDNTILNIIREYLQVLILKAIYQSKYGSGLSFMGGTCLRICYDLKRFSEDLDFALDKKLPQYSFPDLNQAIVAFLKNTDFEVDLQVSEEKVVQKSFIRVSKVLHLFGIAASVSQKIHIKLEVDTNPVSVSSSERETFFVARFNELFPLVKHTNETLFAGKICAVFSREYAKGRDFYDLLWYLNRREKINLSYLNKAMKQVRGGLQFKDERDVMKQLEKRIKTVNSQNIMKELSRFLEDASEEAVIQNYQAAFTQAAERYLHQDRA